MDELSEGNIPRRGNRGRDAEVKKTTTAVVLLYFFAVIIERASGISEVKIKIKMRCRG